MSALEPEQRRQAAPGGLTVMSGTAGSQPPEDWDEHYSSTVLEACKALAVSQAELAERVADRARQAFLYLGGVFAVTQAAALSSFKANLVTSGDRKQLLGWAIAAAIGVGLTGLFALATNVLRRYKAIGPDDIAKVSSQAVDNDEDVALLLAAKYRDQVKQANGPIRDRRMLLGCTQVLAALTFCAIVIEVIVALDARVS